VLTPGPEITVADLPAEVRKQPTDNASTAARIEGIDDTLSLAEAINVFTRVRIRKALEAVGHNQTEAAKRLSLPQSNLSRLMKRLGLR